MSHLRFRDFLELEVLLSQFRFKFESELKAKSLGDTVEDEQILSLCWEGPGIISEAESANSYCSLREAQGSGNGTPLVNFL